VLTVEHFREQMAKGSNVLVCTEYKTNRTYGDLGKHLAPATVWAMKLYDSAMDKFERLGGLFFQPCTGEGVNLDYYIKKFAKEHFQNVKAPNSNLIRTPHGPYGPAMPQDPLALVKCETLWVFLVPLVLPWVPQGVDP